MSSTQRNHRSTLSYTTELSKLSLTAQQRAKTILYVESIITEDIPTNNIQENSTNDENNEMMTEGSKDTEGSENTEDAVGQEVQNNDLTENEDVSIEDTETTFLEEKQRLLDLLAISTGPINEADFRIALAELRVISMKTPYKETRRITPC